MNMKVCKICSKLDDLIPRMSLNDFPELKAASKEMPSKKLLREWRMQFECTLCGQKWEEYYEATGHGEVASLKKIEAFESQ